MRVEEFTTAGCTKCGGHEFSSPGPIGQPDSVIVCADPACGAEFLVEYVGQLDGDSWEQERNQYLGIETVHTRTVYHTPTPDEFVTDFVEKVEE